MYSPLSQSTHSAKVLRRKLMIRILGYVVKLQERLNPIFRALMSQVFPLLGLHEILHYVLLVPTTQI